MRVLKSNLIIGYSKKKSCYVSNLVNLYATGHIYMYIYISEQFNNFYYANHLSMILLTSLFRYKSLKQKSFPIIKKLI